MESLAIIGKLFSYQPVLDARGNVAGLLLQQPLSADHEAPPQDAENTAESARQIINALIYAGMSEPSTRYRYWLEVDAGFLRGPLPDYLPGEKIVLVVTHPDPTDASLTVRCAQLKTQRNYRLAIKPSGNGAALQPSWKKLADVLWLDAAVLDDAAIQSWHAEGCKVFTQPTAEQPFQALAARGVDYLLGEAPVKPAESGSDTVLAQKAHILELIQQLSNYESSSDRSIEAELKKSPEILMHLLELAGAAHLGIKSGLSSIRQILQAAGRQRIINWLYVLWLCARDGDTGMHALAFRALWRSRFMEQLVHYSHRSPGSHMEDQAFMTGLLSLAPALLGISETELFERMCIDINIQEAVTERGGLLGQLLNLTQALEGADFDNAEQLCRKLHLDTHTVMHCQQEAIAWVNKTHRMVAD